MAIETTSIDLLGVVFHITQMDAEKAITLQAEVVARREEAESFHQKGDTFGVLSAYVDDDDSTFCTSLLSTVKLSDGTSPDFDELFAGEYVKYVELIAKVIDLNYGFLFHGDEMYLGDTPSEGEPQEREPMAITRAKQRFSQSQLVYAVLSSERVRVTLHELQTIYCLHDLYKLYEIVSLHHKTIDTYHKQQLAAQK